MTSATITLTGSIGHNQVKQARMLIHDVVLRGARHVVIDVSRAWDIDASLLAILAHTRGWLGFLDGSLRVTGVVVPELLPAMRDAPLNEAFLVYDAVRSGA